MAGKLKPMESWELMQALQDEGLLAHARFVVEPEPDRTPGTVGISRTKAKNYMVYMVDADAKLYNTSVHEDLALACGMVLRRMRALAGEGA